MGPGSVEMMLEGRVLSPAEAGEIGLVHRVVSPDRLLAEATATAERLARRAPGSVAALKRAVYEGGSKELEQGLRWSAIRAYVEELERLGEPPRRAPRPGPPGRRAPPST